MGSGRCSTSARSATRGFRRRLCSTLPRCASSRRTAARAHRGVPARRRWPRVLPANAGRMRGLVHQRDQRAARQQVFQQLGQHLVAEHARQHHVEVGQQPRAARDVGARHRAASVFRCWRSSATCASLTWRTVGWQHAASSMVRTSNTWRASARWVWRRRRARRLQGHQPVAAELVQRLAHQRAATRRRCRRSAARPAWCRASAGAR